MSKPWLLIDIDGVLNPMWGPKQLEESAAQLVAVNTSLGRLHVVVHKPHGKMLLAMEDKFRVAWATWWMHEANNDFRHHHNLPEFPVVEFNRWSDGFTKVDGILRFVGSDPFVWIDDDISLDEEQRLASNHPAHLVVRVDPLIGLTDEHLATALQWGMGIEGE